MRRTTTFLLVLVTSLPLAAQWLGHRDPRIPRTKNGTANLTAPAPRLNGKPDLTGLWEAARGVRDKQFSALQIDSYEVSKEAGNIFGNIKPEEEPLRPEAAAILRQRRASPAEYTHARCLPGSIPLAMLVLTFKMIQTPQEIVMLSETADPPRQIFIDGRSLPKDPEPSWMGNSVGRWQGDTLIVETNGLNDKGWIDATGHPRSEAMKITERYQRRDFGHMNLEIIFDDPKYYTRPFTLKTVVTLVPDSDLLEYVCAENEKDRIHLPK